MSFEDGRGIVEERQMIMDGHDTTYMFHFHRADQNQLTVMFNAEGR